MNTVTPLKHTGIFALGFLLIATIITSSCGVSDAVAATTNEVGGYEQTEDGEFCNCHLKAELNTTAAYTFQFVPQLELAEIILPASSALIVPKRALMVHETEFLDRIPIPPPEQRWPIRLARSHL